MSLLNNAEISGDLTVSGTISGQITVSPKVKIEDNKNVTPSNAEQVVTPSENFDALAQVTVGAVSLQDKSVTPSASQQTVTADEGYNGLGTVTVNAASLQNNKNVTPSASQQQITPDSGYIGLKKVTVNAVADKFNFLMNNNSYSSRPTFEVNQDGGSLEGFTYGYNITVISSGSYNHPVQKAFYYQKYLKNIVADGWEGMENGEELAYSGIVTGHFASLKDFMNTTFKGCNDITDLYFGYNGVIRGMLMSGRIFDGRSSGTVNIHVPSDQLANYQADSTWTGIIAAEAAAGVTVNLVGDYA